MCESKEALRQAVPFVTSIAVTYTGVWLVDYRMSTVLQMLVPRLRTLVLPINSVYI